MSGNPRGGGGKIVLVIMNIKKFARFVVEICIYSRIFGKNIYDNKLDQIPDFYDNIQILSNRYYVGRESLTASYMAF